MKTRENEKKKQEIVEEMRGGIHGLGMPSRPVFPVVLLDLPDFSPPNALLLYVQKFGSNMISVISNVNLSSHLRF